MPERVRDPLGVAERAGQLQRGGGADQAGLRVGGEHERVPGGRGRRDHVQQVARVREQVGDLGEQDERGRDAAVQRAAHATLLVGAVGWVLHGLQRAFVLCRASALRFGWLSVTPALTLLVAVAVLLALESERYAFALAASGVASALLGALQLRSLRAAPGWTPGAAAPWRTLWTTGTHAFAQSVVIALQPWLTFVLLSQHGASVAEVGQFVLAAYVYQAFVLPAGFVAPLLFARISAAIGAKRDYAVQDRLRRALLVTALVAGLAALSLPPVVPALFGAAYAPAVAACVWLALSGPLVLANRLGVAVLLGRAHFRAASAHAVLRALLVPFVVSVCLWLEPARAVTSAAFAWCLVEALCAGALLLWWRATSPSQAPAIESRA